MPVALRRLLVVLAVAGAGLVPAPATAAGYCTGSGVNVVVDFGALGGGIQKGCDGSGNHNAAHAFTNTGHPLTYASSQPGFVCRVDGVPQSDPCVTTSPSNAYWGLYWSDGTSGWKYASTSAGSLTVPAGGTVAFSWQNGGTADPPGTAPASRSTATSPTPTPTRQPSTKPSRKPSGGGTAPASPTTGSTSATTDASASPTATGSASASATPSAAASSPSASPSVPGAAAVSEPEVLATAGKTDEGGLDWWVPLVVLLALAGGAGGIWWNRRRTTSG